MKVFIDAQNVSFYFTLKIVSTLVLLVFGEKSKADSEVESSKSMAEIYSKIIQSENASKFGNNTTLENNMRVIMRSLMKNMLPTVIDIVGEDSVSNDCMQSLIKYTKDLINVKAWAMEMFDSTSKLPSGILEGTLSELGSYDQCLDIVLPSENHTTGLRGQYCGVEMNQVLPPLPSNFYLSTKRKTSPLDPIGKFVHNMGSVFFFSKFRLGLCVPSKCTLLDMQRIALQVQKKIRMEVLIRKCYIKEPIVFEPIHIVVFCCVSILVLLSIWGSCLEYRYGAVSITQKKYSKFQSVLLCFSLISNYLSLIESSGKSDRMKAIQGIKALTIAWVMFGHNYAWTNFALARRPKLMFEAYQKLEFGLILNSWLSVEPFFLVNGLLASYSVLQLLPLTKGKINVPLYILRRYFKVLSLLLLTIGLAFFMPIVGSGPFWFDVVDQELQNCRDNWWYGILFISNWISMKEICISTASWYISTDLQLHAVSIIPLYVLYKSRRFGVVFVIAIIIACSMAIAIITFQKDLLPIVQMSSGNKQKIQDTIDYVHLRTYTHAGPYYVGILLGVILLEYKNIRLNLTQNILGWMGSILLALSALYGAHSWNIGRPHGPLLTALFASTHRTVFALAVAWVVFVCITRNGGPVNMLLSSRMLVPAGKLTFMIFMLHSLVFWVRKASVRERIYVSHYNLIYAYVGNIVFTVMISIPCYLLLEAPLTNLESLLFPPHRSKAEKIATTQEKEEHLPANIVIHNNAAFAEDATKPDIQGTQNIFISYPSGDVTGANSYKTVIHIQSNFKNR